MVQSANVTSTGTLVAAGPVYVIGVYCVAGATAGSVILKDGGGSGTAKFTIQTPASAAAASYVDLGAGILFATDVHATISNAAGVTVVYQ